MVPALALGGRGDGHHGRGRRALGTIQRTILPGVARDDLHEGGRVATSQEVVGVVGRADGSGGGGAVASLGGFADISRGGVRAAEGLGGGTVHGETP